MRQICVIKVDLKKAYDMMHWEFILTINKAIEAPTIFIELVKECITTFSFSMKINWELKGFFKKQKRFTTR